MNRAWLIRSEQRIARLEQIAGKGEPASEHQRIEQLQARADEADSVAEALAKQINALTERVEALEARRGPGRPPKGAQ